MDAQKGEAPKKKNLSVMTTTDGSTWTEKGRHADLREAKEDAATVDSGIRRRIVKILQDTTEY